MSDPMDLVVQQIDRRLVELAADVREVRRQTEPIPAIERHLRELNGRMGRAEGRLDRIEEAVDGELLLEQLAQARAQERAQERGRPLRWGLWVVRVVGRDGFVLKTGMGLALALLGVEVGQRWFS